MAIPEKPLEVNFDPNQMKVKDWRKLAHMGDNPDYFVDFLATYTNWSAEEIDELTMEEVGEAAKQFTEAVQKQSVPLVSLPSSSPGPE